MPKSSRGRQACYSQRYKGDRDLCARLVRVRLLRQADLMRVLFSIAVCTSFDVVPAAAQPEVIPCAPPEAPMSELPVEVLAEYRSEIAAEFEAYFSAVTAHIACLDAERARAMDEARGATEAYARLFQTISDRKDPP